MEGGGILALWPGAHSRTHLGRRLPEQRSVIQAAGPVGPGSKVLHFRAASLVPGRSKASPHQLAKSGRPPLTAHAWPGPWGGGEGGKSRRGDCHSRGPLAAPPQPRRPHLQRPPREVKGNKQRLAAAPPAPAAPNLGRGSTGRKFAWRESPARRGGGSEVAGRAAPHTTLARLRAPHPPARVPSPVLPAAPAAPASQTSASRAARAADPGSGRDPEPWPPHAGRTPAPCGESPRALRSGTCGHCRKPVGPAQIASRLRQPIPRAEAPPGLQSFIYRGAGRPTEARVPAAKRFSASWQLAAARCT